MMKTLHKVVEEPVRDLCVRLPSSSYAVSREVILSMLHIDHKDILDLFVLSIVAHPRRSIDLCIHRASFFNEAKKDGIRFQACSKRNLVATCRWST